jgi:hypothetical protein
MPANAYFDFIIRSMVLADVIKISSCWVGWTLTHGIRRGNLDTKTHRLREGGHVKTEDRARA